MVSVTSISATSFSLRFNKEEKHWFDKTIQKYVDLTEVILSDSDSLQRWQLRSDSVSDNLSCVYDIIKCQDKTYVVSEYVKGQPLSSLHLTNDFFWIMARDLICGLKELHDKKISHGDISPNNVIVDMEDLKFVLVNDRGLKSQQEDINDLGWLMLSVYRNWDDTTLAEAKSHTNKVQPFANGNQIERFITLLIKSVPEHRLNIHEASKFVEYYL
jgi:hypothetical protein